ncbi:EF-P lysine aminoacylase GenX [Desulfobulbus sp. F5]|nr:EF-P lysine aminoacylase GenX [Desulfobulbus sp. F5]
MPTLRQAFLHTNTMLTPSDLHKRSVLLQAVRSFFLTRNYLEADTPIRLPMLIPEAEIQPLTSEGRFLQTSPELCMKRLLAGGCSRLFQTCRCFRKGERGRLHQEEFAMLEWYQVGWSYVELMAESEALVRELAHICAEQGWQDLPAWAAQAEPWLRLTVEEAFQRFVGISAEHAVATGHFDQLLVEQVEPELGRLGAVFLCDYPIALAALARPKPDKPTVAERVELYINGIELANGFSELTDATAQRRRFSAEMKKAGISSELMPEKFLRAVEQLPDCAGIALGLDRLLMILLGRKSIAEVLPFADEDL